jgi:hypothetical protein
MANVAATNVPPVPNEHSIISIPDSKVTKRGEDYTITVSRINNVWIKWFMDLRTKVNIINGSIVSIATINTPGTVVTDGNGNFTTVDLPAGTYGSSTTVPVVTVGPNGYITNITSVPIVATIDLATLWILS